MTFTIKKIATICAAILYTLPPNALAQEAPQKGAPGLNKISYQVSVEKWSTTTTADVNVSIDATLNKTGLHQINSQVLQNLNKIYPSSDWHITQFNGSQDRSGLETLHIEAEARLPSSVLTELRDKAKAVTTSGQTYTIGDIDFTPSRAELDGTHADARAEIYDEVNQEIARLNQAYPGQHYFLNSIDFGIMHIVTPTVFDARVIQPQAMVSSPGSVQATAAVASNSSASHGPTAPSSPTAPPASGDSLPIVPVNTKIVETASIVIASLTPPSVAPVTHFKEMIWAQPSEFGPDTLATPPAPAPVPTTAGN